MGQYHNIINATRHEYLGAHELGNGVKMLEQSCSYGGVRASLVAFLARRGGNMPADLSYSPLIGRWAGNAIMAIGDYAEAGDLPSWKGELPEPELYRACREKPKRPARGYHWLVQGESETQAILRGKREHQEALAEWEAFCAKHRPVRNVAPKVKGLLESACNIRFKGNDGWIDYMAVKALAERGPDGRPQYVPLHQRADDMAYYLRAGWTDKDWGRAPLDEQHHGLMDGEVDQGQRRVIANLDTREFIDPQAFGEVPTLAGIMRGEDACSAMALMFMLFHHEARGGGDLGRDGHPDVGRWRGNRLVVTAEFEKPRSRFPSTEEVQAGFTDISKPLVKNTARWHRRDTRRAA